MKQVPVVFFLEPIEVDDEEAAQLARHGLVRDDDKSPKPDAKPGVSGAPNPQ